MTEKIAGLREHERADGLLVLEEGESSSVIFVRVLRVLWVASALAIALPATVVADARTDFLIRMLASSDQFRVRTQAALALGSRPPEPAAVRALVGALRQTRG